MSKLRIRWPSPALIIAAIALFVGLGGGAYAASHKVTTSDIANKAVTTSKLAKKAVTSKKLAKKAVTSKILAKGAVKEKKLSDGVVTASKLGLLTVRTSSPTSLPPDAAPGNGFSQAKSTEVSCDSGEVAIGGGIASITPEVDGAQDGHVVSTSFVADSSGKPVGIVGRAGHDTGSAVTAFTVEVLCLET